MPNSLFTIPYSLPNGVLKKALRAFMESILTERIDACQRSLFYLFLPLVNRLRTLDWGSIGKMVRESNIPQLLVI